MRIGIVGAGAVGLYYGARLQRASEDAHFLVRSDFDAIARSGIAIRAPDASFQLRKVNVYRTTDQIGPVDLVILGLKATSNGEIPSLIKPMVHPGTIILSMQNGLGAVPFLESQFPRNSVLGGSCFICLNRVKPGTVENFYVGRLGVTGRDQAARDAIANMFKRAGVNARAFEDMNLLQWKKLLWNIPFNGLSIAAGQVSTDVIISDPNLSRLARGLMEEVVAIASALGLVIDSKLIDRQFEMTKTMGDYRPSSLVDFQAGRSVEVEAIWGEPLRKAIAAGVDAPKLETLYRLLRIACRERDAENPVASD